MAYASPHSGAKHTEAMLRGQKVYDMRVAMFYKIVGTIPMKTLQGLCITIITTGIWLLFIQSAQAFDIRSCHLLPSNDLNPQVTVSHLPEVQLGQLKTAWHTQGSALFNLAQHQEPRHSFEQAMAINPSYHNAQRNRSVLLRQLERIASH